MLASSFSIIEGFYGRTWQMHERVDVCRLLAPRGLSQYMYAPKADQCLRRAWAQPIDDHQVNSLQQLSSQIRSLGIQFGVGLSPFEIYLDYQQQRPALYAKLQQLQTVGLDFIGILFDDMRGDLENLAEIQVSVLHDIAAWFPNLKIIACPTYYSFDPILDKVFGQRPKQYLSQLGNLLDSNIDIFWTGDKVVSQSYGAQSLANVTEQLQRQVVLWDNYPVNDGARMSRYLHLDGVTQLDQASAIYVKGRFANPMNQPYLSQISLASFGAQLRTDYQPSTWLGEHAEQIVGERLSKILVDYSSQVQTLGLDDMTDQDKQLLRAKLLPLKEPAAQELLDWLDEGYEFDPDCLTD